MAKKSNVTGKLLTTESVMKALDNVKTEFEARNLFQNSFYGAAGEDSVGLDSKDVYKARIKITWDMFYKVLSVENKFHITDHFCSAYCLVNLMKPKIIAMYNSRSKGATNQAELSDYIQSCWFSLSGLMEVTIDEKGKAHGFDSSINDNACAYTQKQLLTILNEVFKPEIPKYIQDKNNYTLTSLNAMLENEESNFEAEDSPDEFLEEIDDTKNELYKPDFRRMSVEDYCIAKIMSEQSGKSIGEVVVSEDFTQTQKIRTVYTNGKLGFSDEELAEARAMEEAELEAEKEAV